MYKIYFKQALHLLKQDKLISIISIAGTALAITMIMVIVIMREIKVGNTSPEVNRNRTLFVNTESLYTKDGKSRNMSSLSYRSIKECFLPLKTSECISASMIMSDVVVNMEGNNQRITYNLRQTDDNFWKIYSFSFIDGKPFSKADFESGLHVAVINQTVAQQIFKGEQAVGKTIDINFIPYKVVGVVKNVSSLCKSSFAEVWTPYTSVPSYQEGFYNCAILAKSSKDFEAVKEEVLENQKRLSSVSERDLELNGPYTISEMTLSINEIRYAADTIKADRRKNILILCIILLIPAINLSSFSLSRIKKRMSEIGVRKAFGASKISLMSQVLYENMLTTLLGGLFGLVLSIIAILCLKNILLMDESGLMNNGEMTFSIGSFFSPSIFLAVFAACIVLNILSASIPAYRASRLPIVNALKS